MALAAGPACLRFLEGKPSRHGQGLEGPNAGFPAAARSVFEPRGKRFVGLEALRHPPQGDLRLEADEEVGEELLPADSTPGTAAGPPPTGR